MSSRRNFLKKSVVLALGAITTDTLLNKAVAATGSLEKESASTPADQYKLLPLPYAYDALEPHIDKQTMEIHYSKHHQGYVNNLNKALETIDSKLLDSSESLEGILKSVDKFPVAIRNNAGGHYNHSLFWSLMKPNGGGAPKGKLAEAIKTHFGSFEEFKKQFTDVAMKRFGSGWAWLVINKGKLSIGSTANQDNPLMNIESVEIKGTPLLALDVWEHAYYLKNQNRRADYITSWWNVVNWDAAEQLFAAAK